MRDVKIYLEGGGDAQSTRADIRLGFHQFLHAVREAAQRNRARVDVVPCGSKVEARDKFLASRRDSPEIHSILLVDSELPVHSLPKQHLIANEQWHLGGVPDDVVHLMAQVFETWLLADPEVLSTFYGQKFLRNALPNANDLETVPKQDVANVLRRATKHTTKEEYHKIRHASALLALISPDKVRRRCRHCDRLFRQVSAVVT